ncbi:class I SAM-dependent methyltransferase [Streptomyces solincola]|nr:class I SAM-dependent methyltransferase [Streptomyces solincola]
MAVNSSGSSRMARRLLRPAARAALRLAEPTLRKGAERAARPLRTDLAALTAEVAELRERQYALSLLVDSTGRGTHRMPTPQVIDALVRQVGAVSGRPEHARRAVVTAFRTLVAQEALGVGRLAGSTSNICGKLAAIPLLAPPNGSILEIGTLHGQFAAALLRMVHRAGLEPELTIVDPLAGSQLQPGTAGHADPTGTPVREDVVRANLTLAGSPGAYTSRIQRGFSSDPEVRKAVADRAYGVVVVDGDHSADGVAADLEWVEEIAAPGAVVVLDDYGDGKWPGVQQAADAHLAGGSRLTLLGRASTSAFLRAD